MIISRVARAATMGVGTIALCLTAIAPAVAEPMTIDAVHSSVLFRIKHLNTSHAWGRFNDVAGTVDLEGADPLIDVQIKSDSVDTGNAKREQHLKSPDFLNVRQFPTISFKSTRIEKSADGKYTVEGTLSLHGAERPLSVQLERTGAGKRLDGKSIAGFETSFKIKRSEFGMKFLLGGLSDEVLLVVSLECAAQ